MEFQIGDTVKLTNRQRDIEYFNNHYRGIIHTGIFTVTGFGGNNTVELNCKSGEHIGRSRLEHCVMAVEDITIIEPVAKTMEGTIYKQVVSGKLVIETDHGYLELTESQSQQIKQYLSSKKQFPDELFTI